MRCRQQCVEVGKRAEGRVHRAVIAHVVPKSTIGEA